MTRSWVGYGDAATRPAAVGRPPAPGSPGHERFLGRSPSSIGEQVAARLGAPLAEQWRQEFELLHRQAVDAGLLVVDGVVEARDAIVFDDMRQLPKLLANC